MNNTTEKKNYLVNRYVRQLFLACALILLAMYVIFESYSLRDTITVGMVMLGSHSDGTRSQVNHEKMEIACEEMNVRLLIEEYVDDSWESCAEAVKHLDEKGANAIVLDSTDYAKHVTRLSAQYPSIVFFCNSVGGAENISCATYSTRLYQARYLAGVLAGLETTNGKIGYVASMENPEVNRGINAFILGVKSIRNDAEVIACFTGSWNDAEKEEKLTTDLIEKENVDIITYHLDDDRVAEIAEKYQIEYIAFHEDKEMYSDNCLAVVKANGEQVYKEMIKDCINGYSKISDIYWLGLEKNAVELQICSDKVSDEAKAQINMLEQRLLEHRDVFSGEIKDNQGNLVCAEDETISDERLFYRCTWLAEGVRVYEEKKF